MFWGIDFCGSVRRARIAAVAVAAVVGGVISGIVLLSGTVAQATSAGTCSESGADTITVTCTAGSGTWTPPAGVTSVHVDAEGGGGGNGGANGAAGGPGGSSTATLAVSSASTYTILAGRRGGGAAGGAGLGGAGGARSEIDLGTSCATSACRLVVAGGGGGGGGGGTDGAGGSGGGGGASAGGANGTGNCPGSGGQPGTETGPGAGGAGASCGGGRNGNGGSGAAGGSGGDAPAINGLVLVPNFGGGGGGGDGFLGGGGGGAGGVTVAPSCGLPSGCNTESGGGGGGGGANHLDSATTSSGSSGPGTNTGDGSVTITYPGPADLGVAITGPSSTKSGTTVAYQIKVSNAGPGTARSVALTDAVPYGTAFSSATPPTGWSCPNPASPTGAITCTAGSMAANTSQTIVLSLKVTAKPNAGVINNYVTVTGSTVDPNTSNNSATAQTAVTK